MEFSDLRSINLAFFRPPSMHINYLFIDIIIISLRPSNLLNGISFTGKMTSLYWIRALVTIPTHLIACAVKVSLYQCFSKILLGVWIMSTSGFLLKFNFELLISEQVFRIWWQCCWPIRRRMSWFVCYKLMTENTCYHNIESVIWYLT